MNAGWSRFVLGAVTVCGLAACGDDGGLPDARPLIDAAQPGQVSLTWTLAHEGAPLTCATVGATQVTVDIVRVGEPFGVVDSFSCASAMGITRDLSPGRYNLKVSLNGGGVLDGPESFFDLEVRAGALTAGPAIAFDVDPSGVLAFRITTPPTGGNCADATAMGAGITAVAIELRDAANVCVPTTFAIAAGATSKATSYASDCAAATTVCIAADQEVRAEGVAAGQHAMVLTGLIGAAPCWKRTAAFSVRAAGQTTTLNPQLLALDPLVPGCPAM